MGAWVGDRLHAGWGSSRPADRGGNCDVPGVAPMVAANGVDPRSGTYRTSGLRGIPARFEMSNVGPIEATYAD